MASDVYAPPLPSSAGHWCTLAFIARGINPEVLDSDRLAFVRIFGPEARMTALRLKPGQGRISTVQWAEPGVLYPRSGGRAVLVNIQLSGEARPKLLSIEATIGKEVVTVSVQQVEGSHYYSNLTAPMLVDRNPRIRVAHTGKWLEKPWDGWFHKSGTFPVQESRKVGNALWNIGLPAAKTK